MNGSHIAHFFVEEFFFVYIWNVGTIDLARYSKNLIKCSVDYIFVCDNSLKL